MHFYSSMFLVLLVFMINFSSRVNAISCTTNKQCKLSQKGTCGNCTGDVYPRCTKGICINGQCGILQPCSITLGESCKTESACPRSFLCKVACQNNYEPICASAKSLKKKCAPIGPCSIQLQ